MDTYAIDIEGCSEDDMSWVLEWSYGVNTDINDYTGEGTILDASPYYTYVMVF